jgi:hypothetical protein
VRRGDTVGVQYPGCDFAVRGELTGLCFPLRIADPLQLLRRYVEQGDVLVAALLIGGDQNRLSIG